MSFSELIKRRRVEKGMTADQVGRLIGRDRQSIYNYESGKSVPSIETLRALVRSGFITPAEALGEDTAA